MKLTTVIPKDTKGIVDYIDNMEVVKIENKIYPLVYDFPNKYNLTLYSLPSNIYHSFYTKRENVDYNKLHNPDIIRKYWGLYVKGDVIEGSIKDNKFIPNENTRVIRLQKRN